MIEKGDIYGGREVENKIINTKIKSENKITNTKTK